MSDKMITVRGIDNTQLSRMQLNGCPGCGRRDMIEALHLGDSVFVVECLRCNWQVVEKGLYAAARRWSDRTVITDVAGIDAGHVWFCNNEVGYDV